jgi:hypothetical protein
MRYNPQKIEYGETYEAPRQVPQAPVMLKCLKCDSENNFIVWPKETETQAINGAPFKRFPTDKDEIARVMSAAGRKHTPEQLAKAMEAAGTVVVNTPAVPQGACRECGCTWFFEWWQCPDMQRLKVWLWAESKESLAVINALKAFVGMPDDEKELDNNHLYTKYYNMLSRHRFGAAHVSPPTPDPTHEPQDTPAPEKLPASSEDAKPASPKRTRKAPATVVKHGRGQD